MKVPMKWLREYTHIALDAQDYAQKMVMSGTGVEGVEKTDVNLKKKRAVVTLNAEVADEALRAAVKEAGYEVTDIR